MPTWSQLRARGRRVRPKDRMFFTERLALLLETGNPLHTSLSLLAEQSQGSPIGDVAATLKDDIDGGIPFSQALAKHPQVFSTTYVNLVGAGEQGGFLPEVLDELMTLEAKTAELKSTLVSAFTYPAFLIFFSVAVVIFVLAVVFPKFSELFESLAGQLPATTLVLMLVSDVLRQYWLVVLAMLGAAGTGVAYMVRTDAGVRFLDGLKLRIPFVRDIFVELYLTQTMRVLGLSLGHGVSVPDTLRACQDVVKNRSYREFMATIAAEVNEGRGFAVGFTQAEFVPPLATQMISAGEESGTLPVVTTRLADFYERELSKRLNLLSKLIEPLMLLVMGVVVGLIVSSLILPIFKLSRAVH